jgi:hypothetical protein
VDFGLIQPVDQLLRLRPLLLRYVEVHHVLSSVLVVAKLLLRTCISNEQVQ